MSIESWKKDFLPGNFPRDMSDLEAIDHALLKFAGCSPENLKKHYVKLSYGGLLSLGIAHDHDEIEQHLGCSVCGLCKKHLYSKDPDSIEECATCPLGDCASQWGEFARIGNTEPMTKLLNKAKERLEND